MEVCVWPQINSYIFQSLEKCSGRLEAWKRKEVYLYPQTPHPSIQSETVMAAFRGECIVFVVAKRQFEGVNLPTTGILKSRRFYHKVTFTINRNLGFSRTVLFLLLCVCTCVRVCFILSMSKLLLEVSPNYGQHTSSSGAREQRKLIKGKASWGGEWMGSWITRTSWLIDILLFRNSTYDPNQSSFHLVENNWKLSKCNTILWFNCWLVVVLKGIILCILLRGVLIFLSNS